MDGDGRQPLPRRSSWAGEIEDWLEGLAPPPGVSLAWDPRWRWWTATIPTQPQETCITAVRLRLVVDAAREMAAAARAAR